MAIHGVDDNGYARMLLRLFLDLSLYRRQRRSASAGATSGLAGLGLAQLRFRRRGFNMFVVREKLSETLAREAENHITVVERARRGYYALCGYRTCRSLGGLLPWRVRELVMNGSKSVRAPLILYRVEDKLAVLLSE